MWLADGAYGPGSGLPVNVPFVGGSSSFTAYGQGGKAWKSLVAQRCAFIGLLHPPHRAIQMMAQLYGSHGDRGGLGCECQWNALGSVWSYGRASRCDRCATSRGSHSNYEAENGAQHSGAREGGGDEDLRVAIPIAMVEASDRGLLEACRRCCRSGSSSWRLSSLIRRRRTMRFTTRWNVPMRRVVRVNEYDVR